MRDSPTAVLRPLVLVRADVNTDATAATMDVIGREHRVWPRTLAAMRAPGEHGAQRSTRYRSGDNQRPSQGDQGGARHQPITVVEKPAEVLRFKAACRKGRDGEPSCEGCGESPHSVRPT